MAEMVRKIIQLASTVVFNSYAAGFASGNIYRGNLKQVCVPFLNCYSCPGAISSCPIGSLQAVATGASYQFSFYVAGFLALIGITSGRLACGWLCPFGLIQELLSRIPSPKFLLPTWTRYLKYLVLAVFVLLLPAIATDFFGIGTPYFCKWLCPAGTLEAAIPLAIADQGIRGALGPLFTWRLIWLIAIIVFVIIVHRGFCSVFCPLGAFYSLFNRISFFSIRRQPHKCSNCGRCAEVCYLKLPGSQETNHPDCIRCLKCVNNCPNGAMNWEIQLTGKKEEEFFNA